MNKKLYTTPRFEQESIVTDFLMSSVNAPEEVEFDASKLFGLTELF